MEIDVFTLTIVVGGIMLAISQALAINSYVKAIYEYGRAIKEATFALVIVLTIIASGSFIYLLVRNAYDELREIYVTSPEIEEEGTTEEEDSESIEIEEPKNELPQIEEECITESPENEEECKTNEMPKKAKIAKRKNITITLDADKRFFRHKELKLEEIKYLLAKGYRISEHKSLSSNKTEKYLLKPRFNESENHCYVVYAIAEFLESYNIIVSLFATVKPDLIFEIDRIKYAIEVESGSKINKDRKCILNKAEYMKNNFDCWFFVVINRNCVKKYRKIGKTVDIRYLPNFLKKLVK